MSKPSADHTPTHAPMDQFSSVDGELHVCGTPLSALSDAADGLPFFAYDAGLIRARVAHLRELLPASVHLHYAIKANPMPEVVELLAELTDGLDVASAGELELALATTTAVADISFAGPGKSDRDLYRAVESGVIINVESEGELQRVCALATQLDRTPKIALRVNPDFELKSAGMKMGSGAKPFGIDAERIAQILRSLPDMPVQFMGFHIFSGSQSLRSDAIAEAQHKTFELAQALADEAPEPVRWLNLGGGLGVPYFPGEERLELKPIADNLARLSAEAATDLPGAELVMELGRYLVAEAGIYVCRVVDRKVSRGVTYLITDGGLHHHLAASGNFGQVIRKNYPLAVGNRMNDTELERVHVVGPLCTPLDRLGDGVLLPVAQRGDFIVVYQSGAYAYSASPQQFLSHPAPRQFLVGD